MAVKEPKNAKASRVRTFLKRLSLLQVIFFTLLLTLAFAFSTLIYVSYSEHVDPKHVYGSWVEVGAPPYDTEVLTLDENGVYRNTRLVSTTFEFDGSKIFVKTGNGVSIYQMAGTPNSPQLKRIQPNSPTQRLIKSGYEHTVDMQGGGPAKNRRAALAEHFGDE